MRGVTSGVVTSIFDTEITMLMNRRIGVVAIF